MVSTDANEDGAARGKAAPRPLDQGPGAQARRRRAGRAPPGSRGPATGGRPPFPGGKARATRDTGALAGPGAPISAGKFLLGAPVK